MIGTGIVANDWTAFCGNETTAMELNVIDAIFKLTIKNSITFEEEKKEAVQVLQKELDDKTQLTDFDIKK